MGFTLALIFRISEEIEFYLIEVIISQCFYYEIINEDHVDIMYSIFLRLTREYYLSQITKLFVWDITEKSEIIIE
jgi:hypothetical protein